MYELTFIVTPEISEDDLQKLVASIKSFFMENEIEIREQKVSPKKRFSYPIKKKGGGFYVTFDFVLSNTNRLSNIDKELKTKKEILRFLIINKPENVRSIPLVRPKTQIPQIKKKTQKIITPKTKEEKEKEIQEIDKKLDEILKD